MVARLANQANGDVFLRQLKKIVNLFDGIFCCRERLVFLNWLHVCERFITSRLIHAMTVPVGVLMQLSGRLFIITRLMKGRRLLCEFILLFLDGLWWDLAVNLEWGSLQICLLFRFGLFYFATSLAHIPFVVLFGFFVYTKIHRNCGRIKIFFAIYILRNLSW